MPVLISRKDEVTCKHCIEPHLVLNARSMMFSDGIDVITTSSHSSVLSQSLM